MSWPVKEKTFFIIDLLTQMYANLTINNLYQYSDSGPEKFVYEGMGPNFDTLVEQVKKTYIACNATFVQPRGFPTEAQKKMMTAVLQWGASKNPSIGKYSIVMNFANAFLNSSFLNCFNNSINKDWVTLSHSARPVWVYLVGPLFIATLLAIAGWSLYYSARNKNNTKVNATNTSPNNNSQEEQKSLDNESTPLITLRN